MAAAGAVEHAAAVAAGGDEPGEPQLGQVLRDRGPGRADRAASAADVVLAAAQQPQQPQPRGVGEHRGTTRPPRRRARRGAAPASGGPTSLSSCAYTSTYFAGMGAAVQHGHAPVTAIRDQGHGRSGAASSGLRHLVVPHSHDAADRVDSAMEASRAGHAGAVDLARRAGRDGGVPGASWRWRPGRSRCCRTPCTTSPTRSPPCRSASPSCSAAARPRAASPTATAARRTSRASSWCWSCSPRRCSPGYESIRRLAEPTDVRFLWAVALAGLVGAIGNEIAAQVRIRTGRRIGSAALVADGLHARDRRHHLGRGAAVGGRRGAGLALGRPRRRAGDHRRPSRRVTWGAARQVLARLMDAVDPALVEQATAALRDVDGVVGVDGVRLRWIGHALRAEVDLSVPGGVTVEDAHRIAHAAEHELTHAVPRLTAATVHAHPADNPGPCADNAVPTALSAHELFSSRVHTSGSSCSATARRSGRASGSTPGAPTSRSPTGAAAREGHRRRRAVPAGRRRPSLVWCSPRSRARDTAELAGLTVDRVDDRLVEWDYGDYEGVTTEEIRETVPGWTVWTHPCPNGETAEQVARPRRRRARRRAGRRIPTSCSSGTGTSAACWSAAGSPGPPPTACTSRWTPPPGPCSATSAASPADRRPQLPSPGVIRSATEADVPAIVAMVHELAEYERAPEECHLTEAAAHGRAVRTRPRAVRPRRAPSTARRPGARCGS